MTDEGIKPKFNAILSADAVRNSCLITEDEVGIVQRFKSYRELIVVSVKEHYGHDKLPNPEIDAIYSCKIKSPQI